MKLFKKAIVTILVLIIVMTTGTLTVNASNIDAKENEYINCDLKNQIYTKNQELDNNEKKAILNNLNDKDISVNDVLYSTKNTYVISESCDKNGNVLDSHLMTNQEILYDKLPSVKKTSDPVIGSNSTTNTKKTLEIDLVVYKSGNDYVGYGVANWKTKSVSGGKNYPDAAAEDFIAITWGGNGKLKGTTDRSISGKYNNGEKVVFSKAKSDSYSGYCWQFMEKTSGLGSNLNTLSVLQTITRVNPKTNYKKETNVKLTYIHTYSSIKGSISFTPKSDKTLAAGVSLSNTKDQWQLQIDVPGVKY